MLLARIPASTLLAGKIAGIGLLGLTKIGLTALAAPAAVTTVQAIHLPANRGTVLAWAVVWFVLGYALYATVYGALGSLASRAEDAQADAGPVVTLPPPGGQHPGPPRAATGKRTGTPHTGPAATHPAKQIADLSIAVGAH